MNNKFRLITFDVYTALFNIESGLVPALAQVVGGQADGRALFRTWRAKQLEQALISNSLGRERISFWTVTRRALDYAVGQARVEMPESARAQLTHAWNRLPPWGEAQSVLEALTARGYPLAVLSNGDEAMLRALIKHNALKFDYVFASDHAGFYKPHPSIYHLPLTTLGLAAGEVLHVAGGATDVTGAKSAGLPCYWSNRSGDLLLDPALKPDYEFQNLSGLLKIL